MLESYRFFANATFWMQIRKNLLRLEAFKFTSRARHGESGEGGGLCCPMTEPQRLRNAAIEEKF